MVLKEQDIDKRFTYVELSYGVFGYLIETREDVYSLGKLYPELLNNMIVLMINANRKSNYLVAMPRRTGGGYKMYPHNISSSNVLKIYRPDYSSISDKDLIIPSVEVLDDLLTVERFKYFSNLDYMKAFDLINSGETVIISYENFNFNIVALDNKITNFVPQ